MSLPATATCAARGSAGEISSKGNACCSEMINPFQDVIADYMGCSPQATCWSFQVLRWLALGRAEKMTVVASRFVSVRHAPLLSTSNHHVSGWTHRRR
jgi:hypothetical protein